MLVVDDNFNSRDMLVQALQGKGYRVDAASDGLDALKKNRKFQYALILMDLKMPRLDGVSAARLIHAIPERQGTNIIAVSASVSEETRRLIKEAGFCDYIPKPVQFERLFECIRKHLPTVAQQPLNSEALSNIVKALEEFQDTGDFDSLTAQATEWAAMDGYGEYPQLIEKLVNDLDLQSLDAVYERMKHSVG